MAAQIPAHLFRSWMTPQIVMFFISASMCQQFAAVITFITPASVFFCTSRDPCSCTGGPYRPYAPLCSFLSSNSTVQARAAIEGFPGLSAKYIREAGNGTFAIDLEALKTRYWLVVMHN